MKSNVIVAFLITFVSSFQLLSMAEDTPSPTTKAINRHLLSEYGPVKTIPEAKDTLRKALDALVKQGGGVLVIPDEAPYKFFPQNSSQEKFNSPAVTIYDYRRGFEQVYVPALGTHSSDPLRGGACRISERHLTQTLPWSGTYFTQKYLGHYYGGSSSILLRTTQNAVKGKNTKIHVPSLRGFFIGQVVDINCPNQREWIKIKDLGNDDKGAYIVADLKNSFPENSKMYNKNVIGGLSINDVSNCDNQSCSLDIDRAVYGTGDSFNITAHLKYQGNIMSAEGDEGAVIYTAEIIQDMHIFRGKVESWNPKIRELVYQPKAVNPNKIGTSRPIINMNKAKWVTKGKVMVVPPGHTYLRKDKPNPIHSSLIIGDADCGWDQNLIGRWFAVNEPSEYYDNKESLGSQGQARAPLRLWWHITGVEKRKDGRYHLFVESTKWGTNLKAGPRLYSRSNYSTSDSRKKALKYIIAPGAWVSDTRKGISGYKFGNAGIATKGEPRTLVLAPTRSFGSKVDFAKDDPIIQPVGSNVYAPTGFRVRHFNMTPPMPQMGNSSYEATNWGRTNVATALAVHGPMGKLEDILKRQKNGATPFGAAVIVNTATTNTFVVRGPVRNAAFDFWQHDSNIKKIQWRQPRGYAYFYVKPENSNFTFQGGELELSSKGTVKQRGISATDKPAMNLRGMNIPVKNGVKNIAIKFKKPEVDANYSVTVQPTWLTMDCVTEKTKNGFNVEFSQAAPQGAKVDWQLIR